MEFVHKNKTQYVPFHRHNVEAFVHTNLGSGLLLRLDVKKLDELRKDKVRTETVLSSLDAHSERTFPSSDA